MQRPVSSVWRAYQLSLGGQVLWREVFIEAGIKIKMTA